MEFSVAFAKGKMLLLQDFDQLGVTRTALLESLLCLSRPGPPSYKGDISLNFFVADMAR
jgi:hypothetical protein